MPFSGLGFGFSTVVGLVLFVLLIVVVWRGRGNFVGGTPIVLRSFRVSGDPTAATIIEISGRISGVVSWILTLLRLEPEFQFSVTRTDISIRSASLSGIQHTYIPLSAVTATVCGYQRSILAFAFAVLFSFGFVSQLLSGFLTANQDEVGNDMGLAFGFLILAAIAALVYFLSKRIGLWAETLHAHGFNFKRSMIENISVDLPQALKAIEVLNGLVLSARATAGASTTRSTPTSTATMAAGQCPQCSAVNPPDVRFCESCGAPLN